MKRFDHLLAKSEGRVPLTCHLQDVAKLARRIANELQLDADIAYRGAIMHDIGKASPLFQKSLEKDYHRLPGFVFRHEIASTFFISLLSEVERWPIVDMIVAHHKSIYQDAGGKGILDLVDNDRECLDKHLQYFSDWSKDAQGILSHFGFSTQVVSKEVARENFNSVVDYCETRQYGYSKWKGLLIAADHLASALNDNTAVAKLDLFIKPDLSYYERKSDLYPLSLVSTDSPQTHTLVTAPTGAGKTDFLLRRCRGRVFYTLPFQASINAMYERIKADLKDTNADVRLLHASSSLRLLGGDVLIEKTLQRHIGASIKVLTPHQMASLVFGTKGYEAMIVDLKGCDIILDEIHTYSETTQAIVLEIVAILHSIGCRLHIGTATMPSVLYNRLIEILGGEDNVYEVKLDNDTLKSFDRHLIYKVPNISFVDNQIKDAVENKQKILMVCNQVARSQALYEQMQQQFPDVKMMLIHSRFKRGRRNELENDLRNDYNKSAEACIVVSTQVVEVSLDISFDVMVTECAPIDSLIQRFGRINRKRTVETIGHYKPIFVLQPPQKEKGTLPYGQAVLDRTFEALPEGLLKETAIQSLIDQVYPSIECIDIKDHTIFKDGKWRLKELWHKPKSVLLDVMDIDSVCCIDEKDQERYMLANYAEQAKMEIPVSYRSVGHCKLTKLSVGSSPFVIPAVAYDHEFGFLSQKAKPEFYDVTQQFL